MDIEPVLRNRGQGDHGCPPGWGFPLPSTNLPESLPSSKSSPPFTVKNSAVRQTLVSGDVRRAFRADHQCARLARDVGQVQHMVKAGMRYRDEDARLIWRQSRPGQKWQNHPDSPKANQSPVRTI